MHTRRTRRIHCLLSAAIPLLLAGCGGGVVPAPTSFASYNAKTGAFRLDYPSGWEATGGGRSELYNAQFKQGDVSIKVRADLAGSLMAGPGAPSADLPQELRPEVRLHEMGLAKATEEIPGYKEEPAQPVNLPIGRGVKSSYTATGTFGQQARGYRVTALSNDMRITILCQAPADQWETLKPAFEKVINSVGPGKKE